MNCEPGKSKLLVEGNLKKKKKPYKSNSKCHKEVAQGLPV